MIRSPRLLAAATAFFVCAALVPVGAGPAASAEATDSTDSADSADSADSTAQGATARPGDPAGAGIVVGDARVSSTSFVRLDARSRARTTSQPGPSPRAATWPIGGGGATLTTHAAPPTGVPSQQFTRVRMAHYRAYGGVMEAVVDLGAAPDPTTPSWLVLAWGRLTSDGTVCSSAAGSNIGFTATDTDTLNNPVYRGARIAVRPFRFAAARTATWNCAFAQSLSDSTTTATQYDAVINRAGLFRQKPLLSIQVKGRRLKPRGFTRVPVIIRNGRGTVATAPRVQLRVKTRGVAVRYNPRVGTIRPGGAKRGAIFVKDTRRGKGFVTLIVTSKNYRKKITVPVREVRR